MSLENEDQSSPDKALDTIHKSQKKSKFSYTRDFIISLSDLDICKKLPSGFDSSIVSEFEDALRNTQDRQRIPGNLPLQGFRRSSDCGSSPPTRGDSSNYSRGIHGRWGNRSSGQNDKDSDSQSDWDSDSRRRYGSQSWRSCQNPEHDGLLGSGSLLKPSGISGPKVQADDQHLLKRSNEPYHPPRPYKAVPHSRREITDSINDETFGSSELTSQDRAEEERKRRASFELMRKEQHKVLQEKQKSNTDKKKCDFLSDVTESSEQAKDEKRPLERNNELDGSAILPVSNNNSVISSFPSQTPAPRPLVPPGFTSTVLEKNFGPKSLFHTHEKEFGKPEIEESLKPSKYNPVQNGTLDNQEDRKSVHEMDLSEQLPDENSIHLAFLNNSNKIMNSSSGLEVSKKKIILDDHLYITSSLSQDNDQIVELITKKVTGDKIVSDPNQENSTSVLEKLFGSAGTVNSGGSSGFIENHVSKPDDPWSPNTAHSSKFSQWLLEDEQKPAAADLSSGRQSNLLSLIVGGEKNGSQISDIKVTSTPVITTGILTCEDLEQTILSEYSENSSTLQPPVQDWIASGEKTVMPKEKVDNQASQHLLSLLQKGTGPKDEGPPPNIGVRSFDEIGLVLDKPREPNANIMPDLGKSITLEALFGSAFMKELQSVEAPVSVRTDVFDSPLINDSLLPCTNEEIGMNRRNHENNVLALNQTQQKSKLDRIENWLRFDDAQIEVDSFNKFDGAVDIQLPEEESLITVADPALASHNSMYTPSGNSTEDDFVSSNTPIDIAEKMGALNAGFIDERSRIAHGGPPFVCGSYESVEANRQFHPPQMSQGRPLFHPLDSQSANINPQMKFLYPESIIQRNSPPNNQFPVNMIRPPFHHPNTGTAGFDLPAHYTMLQQMQKPGNFPSSHGLHEFSRGSSLPPHPSNQTTGFMRDPIPMQGGFPFDQRLDVNGLGTPLPASDVSNGGNHRGALQRLLGMELRANPKQMHPYGISHSQGMYNHELDMGFKYR